MFAKFRLKDITLTVNGFFKNICNNRLGCVTGSQKYIKTVSKLFTHTIIGTNPFIQEVAIVAFDCDEYVEKMRAEYSQSKNYFIHSLNSIPIVTCFVLYGSFYTWCGFDIKGNIADELLSSAKVIGALGMVYGKGFDKYMRFSFTSSMDELKEA